MLWEVSVNKGVIQLISVMVCVCLALKGHSNVLRYYLFHYKHTGEYVSVAT